MAVRFEQARRQPNNLTLIHVIMQTIMPAIWMVLIRMTGDEAHSEKPLFLVLLVYQWIQLLSTMPGSPWKSNHLMERVSCLSFFWKDLWNFACVCLYLCILLMDLVPWWFCRGPGDSWHLQSLLWQATMVEGRITWCELGGWLMMILLMMLVMMMWMRASCSRRPW